MAWFKRTYLAYAFLGVVLLNTTIWALIQQPGPVFYFSVGWLVVISILLWAGNRFMTKQLDRLMPWSRWGNSRFFIQLFIGLAYLLLLINLTYYFIKVVLTTSPPSSEQVIVMNVWGAGMFIPVFSIYFSLHFLSHWRKSELAAETFKREHIRSQLDSLKNHLDPHFLFNNLNILSSLIDKDKESSRVFINKFAEVYRSILRVKSDDLIPLQEELGFIDAYIYLIRTRFEDNIRFSIVVDKNAISSMLPPLTLQMLIENAIKHNIITETSPLVIRIYQPDNRSLIVSNTLNKKEKEPALGLKESGLQNIQKRYSHFTDREVKVLETATHFEVHLPVLEIEHA